MLRAFVLREFIYSLIMILHKFLIQKLRHLARAQFVCHGSYRSAEQLIGKIKSEAPSADFIATLRSEVIAAAIRCWRSN
jgi:hypothetical protein